MKDIQQLIKKNSQDGRYESIFPKTFTDAVIDRENGAKLTDILAMFNMLFLSYVGSKSLTRLEVPISLRKKGIWITYVLYDKTVVTEWYAGEAIDDTSFSNDSNWRDGTNSLVGDISISSDGYWVINGEVTTIEAQGEAGITPILRVGSNNHLQVSYTNGSSYIDVSPNPVYTQFRVLNNKLQQSTDLGNTYTYISEELAYKFQESGNKLQMSKDLGDTWEDVSDYIAAWFRFTGTTGSSQADNVGKIQISRDKGNTWTDLSGVFTNSLHIKGYVATVDALPSTAVQGDIYGVGPIYDPSDTEQTNPIYQLYVKDSTGWVNNGRFTSIAAGVVQTTGTSITEVMSQNAVTTELDSLHSDLGQLDEKLIIDDAASDLSFADSNYNEIVQFKNGGIKTKNFDSKNIKAEQDYFLPADYYHKGESPKSYNTSKKLCIITAGQSNADGRNSLESMPLYLLSALPISNCLFYGNGKSNDFIPLDYNNQTHITTWAFDLPCIYQITRNQDMYEIKTTRGSTSIDPTGDGNGYHWTADYEELSDESKSMLLKFENDIRTGLSLSSDFEIRAMLWHQGEGDSTSTIAIENYYKNLKNLFAYIRGVVGNERLPIVSGTISHASIQYNPVIEEAQLRVAQEDPYVTYIDMSGATLLSDNLHFDASASEYLGKKAYDALIDFGVIIGTKLNPVAPWD